MHWKTGYGTTALLALLLGCAGTDSGSDATEPRVAGGERLYHQYCGSCHGRMADGQGAVAAALRESPADLTRIAARRGGGFPDAEVLRIIQGLDPVVSHGQREMPVWGERFAEGVPPEKFQAARRDKALLIVQYLRSIQR